MIQTAPRNGRLFVSPSQILNRIELSIAPIAIAYIAKNCAPTAQELLRAGTMFRFTVVPKGEEAPQNRKSAVEYMERALQLLRTFRLKAG